MKLKSSLVLALFGLVAATGCSSGGSKSMTSSGSVASSAPSSSSTTIAPSKWTTEAKVAVRQLMAIAYQAPQLDCAVQVITSIYSPEDWAYSAAHSSSERTGRAKELEDRSVKELEQKCGIKDTRAEDKAKADAIKAWNDSVDEWNKLTEQRDANHQSTVVIDGHSFESYQDWAKAFGKPLSPPSYAFP